MILQRLAEAAAVGAAVGVGLGVLDFGLRLPGWLRGLVMAGLVGWGLWWLAGRLVAAWRFGPSVAALALRVERLEPRLAGVLASALEFALHPQKYAPPAVTAGSAALARVSVAAAQRALAAVPTTRLIDYGPTGRRGAWLAAAMLVVAGLVWWAPVSSGIAASRWLMPWGDTAWPRWTAIEAAALPGGDGGVVAADAAVEFSAAVTRGYRPGMRVWLHVRETGEPDAPLQQTTVNQAAPGRAWLMTEQTGARAAAAEATGVGRFKLQWRADTELVRRAEAMATSARPARDGDGDGALALEYWFEAGDDRTPARPLRLAARPALRSATVAFEPPSYAAGRIAPLRISLNQSANPTAAALEGSRVTLTLGLSKPLPATSRAAAVLVPGLADAADLEITVLSEGGAGDEESEGNAMGVSGGEGSGGRGGKRGGTRAGCG